MISKSFCVAEKRDFYKFFKFVCIWYSITQPRAHTSCSGCRSQIKSRLFTFAYLFSFCLNSQNSNVRSQTFSFSLYLIGILPFIHCVTQETRSSFFLLLRAQVIDKKDFGAFVESLFCHFLPLSVQYVKESGTQ